MNTNLYNALKSAAQIIRTETGAGQNTAERVGKMFEDIIDAIRDHGVDALFEWFELVEIDGVEWVRSKKPLRSSGDLSANGNLEVLGSATLFGGLTIGDFLHGLISGKGARIDQRGNAEFQSLQVRGSLTVQEIIYNRLKAEESDTSFADSGTIETVVLNPDRTHTLTMRKRWDNDFTSFQVGDVVRGKVNNLLTTGQVFTSWFRVLSVDTATNTLEVICYDDEEVPEGVNYPPEPTMVISRWGNAITPTDGTYNTRQTTWYISSNEGRIVYLQGVWKPILEPYNIGLFIGLPIDMPNIAPFNPDPTKPYIYAKGIFTENLTQVDYLGNPIRTERNRGLWSQAVSLSDDPYIMTDSTIDTVYYNGCKWQCLVSRRTIDGALVAQYPDLLTADDIGKECGALGEPKYNSTEWLLVEGYSRLAMDIDTGGYSDITWGETMTITCRVLEGNIDRTSEVIQWQVTRDSGDPVADAIWETGQSGFAGVLTVMYNSTRDDIHRTDGLSTVFHFTATLNGTTQTTGTLIL